MCTKFPSLNNAIAGEDGGKGTMNSRAFCVDSFSTPAKTVVRFTGTLSAPREAMAPGLAVPAAHPQTEFTMTKVVPSLEIAFSTSSLVYNALKPAFINSSRIGFTNSSGYIIIIYLRYKYTNNSIGIQEVF